MSTNIETHETDPETIESFRNQMDELMLPDNNPNDQLYFTSATIKNAENELEDELVIEVVVMNGKATLGNFLIAQSGVVLLQKFDEAKTDPLSGTYPNTLPRTNSLKIALAKFVRETDIPAYEFIKTLPARKEEPNNFFG